MARGPFLGTIEDVRRITVLVSTCSILLLVAPAQAAEKARGWRTGKVLDSDRARYFTGTVGNTHTTGSVGAHGTYQGNTNTSQTAIYRTYQTFVIDGDTHLYVAQQRLRSRRSKGANLTVNAPVKFAIEKRKLIVLDEDGKQHGMEIIKQVLKSPAPEKAQQ